MNFRILKYFLTVAREQNITKAADILHNTQPPLSRQLKQLEDDLGAVLFERSQNKMLLTEEGNLLVHRAQEILELVEKTEKDLRNQETNLSGNICIGAGEIFAVNTLADILRAFQEKHAGVTFDLFTNTSDVIMEKMEKGLLDIAMLQEPIDIVNYNFISMPQKEIFGVLMRSDAPLTAKEFVTVSDLAGRPLLLPARLQVRSAILNWLSSGIYKMKFAGTCNLLGNAMVLAERNNYYCITITPPQLDERILCFRPLEPPVNSKLYLAWRRSTKPTLTVQKFIEFAQCFLGMV